MLRRITQAFGRYKAGEFHDYPRATWVQMAKDVGRPLEEFSEELDPNVALTAASQSGLGGRKLIRRRLGTAA